MAVTRARIRRLRTGASRAPRCAAGPPGTEGASQTLTAATSAPTTAMRTNVARHAPLALLIVGVVGVAAVYFGGFLTGTNEELPSGGRRVP